MNTTWQRPYGADLHQVDKPVEVRFPLTAEQAQGDRAHGRGCPGGSLKCAAPMSGRSWSRRPGLGRTEAGEIPAPGVPDDELFFPSCFRDASEIREPVPEAEAGT